MVAKWATLFSTWNDNLGIPAPAGMPDSLKVALTDVEL